MIKATICVCLLAILASAAPRQDLMTKVPVHHILFRVMVHNSIPVSILDILILALIKEQPIMCS